MRVNGKISGLPVSTTPNISKKLENIGKYVLEFTYSDFFGRNYSYTGTVRVLDPVTYNKLIAVPISANLPLL